MKRLIIFIIFNFVVLVFVFAQKEFPDKVRKMIRNNDVAGVKECMSKKLNENSVDDIGNTLLHYCCHYDNSIDVVKMLVAKGSKLEAKNKYGYTPLHLAALNGSKKIIQFLLEAGADKQATDNQGFTPYERAKWVKQDAVLDMLK